MKLKINNMKNIITGLSIIIFSIILDQFTKYLIVSNFTLNDRNFITIIKNFIYISYVQNSGAAWSLLQGNAFILVGLTGVVLLFVLAFIFFTDRIMLTVPLAMIAGGGIGNLIDRIWRTGGVVDFIDVYIFGYDFPIFNAADSILVCGTILLLIYVLFFYKETNRGFGRTVKWMR